MNRLPSNWVACLCDDVFTRAADNPMNFFDSSNSTRSAGMVAVSTPTSRVARSMVDQSALS